MRAVSMFNKVAGKRWFSILLLGGAATLLALTSVHLGRKVPPLPALTPSTGPRTLTAPIEKIEQLSSKTAFLRVKPFVNGNEPFYTLNFQPPPAPPPAQVEPPKPLPPPVKKISILYQGVYQTANGGKKAFVQIDSKLSILPTGSAVAADWAIADIGLKNLTLTNRANQTNLFNFNHGGELTVPAN